MSKETSMARNLITQWLQELFTYFNAEAHL